MTDIIGASGVFIILLAYVLNITARLQATDKRFLALNFLGATLACIASIMLKYVPFIVLEGIWALVSLIGLVKVYSVHAKE